ncbi:cell cycle regulator of non-homologous end joining [Talpa occidentalis]|uniref:cell cycle regulator of non-homologous end joining n=1 Tax=Talpa occidentalis TaxID=50954 RepID=UPI0018907102|nr:cell cycle regulator of non-homologous end joining [Talpa occidentalis]XP_037369639.1 cell cycle regulator of non-homologous end joining [Talpa occidentalis]XP_037369650.1 cell cycle regulator of non-homologous end joining [Talpa occidentalis]XP_037369658.1 cell cycle regulator of non-homologous end joining [Talpa occidentalis]XP_037369668.1 cell cycle regulator of non-homologous end joining [Talpa occidentalis]XP_037369674.1 cell cycle regulator of non-homologous end joining [Talpa occiden
MESLKSNTKKRVLPSWMTTQVTQKSKGWATTPKRSRTTAAAAKGDIRLPAAKTVYCMNEAELVDVALGILIEGRKQEKLLEQPFLAGADRPELSPTGSGSPSASSSGSSGGSEDEDNGEDALPPGGSPSQGPGGSASACPSSPGEDEDVLKYVREIFFS